MSPAKSQAQAHYMGLVASGKIKKPGLSAAQAKEYTRGQKVKSLPKKAKGKK